MKSIKPIRRAVSDDYLELVRELPLRPLRNDNEHDEAVRFLTGLVGAAHRRLSTGQREYADALGCIIREYDDRVYLMTRPKTTPLELVRSLMAEHGMGVADLGKVLGSATAASLFLSGKRHLSKNHIRRLAERFAVAAGAFL